MTDDEFPLHDHEPSLTDPRIPARVEEFRSRVLERYPDATFEVKRGGEPPGVYLMATVDVEDSGEVLDTIMDRLLEVQVEEYLPVYVIPVRPLPELVQAIGRTARISPESAGVAGGTTDRGS